MSRTKYTQRFDNEEFEIPNGQIYKLACCDCGLVHKIVLYNKKLKTGESIKIATARDNRATAARRRKKK